jgi:hypothetical protein
MASGITQAETEAAEQHQPEEDQQQRGRAQGEFGVMPGFGLLKLPVVENSPHTSSPNSICWCNRQPSSTFDAAIRLRRDAVQPE